MLRAAREIRGNYYLVPLLNLSPPVYASLDWALLNAGSPLQRQQQFLAFLLREYPFKNLQETFNLIGDPFLFGSSRAKGGRGFIDLRVCEYKSTASQLICLEFREPNPKQTTILEWSLSTPNESTEMTRETFAIMSTREEASGMISSGPKWELEQERFFTLFAQFS